MLTLFSNLLRHKHPCIWLCFSNTSCLSVCRRTHLSGTAARAAAGPSCWGSRCCSWARSRTTPPTRSGCRTAGGKPAALHVCWPPTASSTPWKSLTGSRRRWKKSDLGRKGTQERVIEVRLTCCYVLRIIVQKKKKENSQRYLLEILAGSRQMYSWGLVRTYVGIFFFIPIFAS